jgi:hypothetical protein
VETELSKESVVGCPQSPSQLSGIEAAGQYPQTDGGLRREVIGALEIIALDTRRLPPENWRPWSDRT